jgi:hypothetical protein
MRNSCLGARSKMRGMWMIPMSMTKVYLKECMKAKRKKANARDPDRNDNAVVNQRQVEKKQPSNAGKQETTQEHANDPKPRSNRKPTKEKRKGPV